MKKPIIGIVPTFHQNENDPYLDQTRFVNMYAEKIIEAGGIPIGILSKNLDRYFEICDGYLWPGGTKIEWSYQKIFLDALKNKKPVLGICLGMQAITTFFNLLEDKENSLSDDLGEIYEENKKNTPYLKKLENGNIHFHIVTKDQITIEKSKHPIKIEKNSILYDIYKKEKTDVVSLHSFIVARTSKNIMVSARSEDQTVEAVEYKKDGNLFLGLQWHPEIIENDNKVFEWLVTSCLK